MPSAGSRCNNCFSCASPAPVDQHRHCVHREEHRQSDRQRDPNRPSFCCCFSCRLCAKTRDENHVFSPLLHLTRSNLCSDGSSFESVLLFFSSASTCESFATLVDRSHLQSRLAVSQFLNWSLCSTPRTKGNFKVLLKKKIELLREIKVPSQ